MSCLETVKKEAVILGMIPYNSIQEDSELKFVTSFQITTRNKGLPNGTYAFVPYYCDVASCDCREVWVQVVQTEMTDDGHAKTIGESLAFINYGWESPEFYANDQKALIGKTYFPGIHLDADRSPSEYAGAFLELFINTLEQNDEFRFSLEEQYYDFKFRMKEKAKNSNPIAPSFQPPSFLPSFRKKRIKLR